jgi:hypothetical protein
VVFIDQTFDCLCFLVILSSECGVLLYVMLCDAIWFPVLLQCSFHLQKVWASTLQIRSHRYFDNFNFIILFVVGILLLYAINLNIVSMLADTFFTFLVMLNMWLYDAFYQFKWMSIILFLSKKSLIIDLWVKYVYSLYKLGTF